MGLYHDCIAAAALKTNALSGAQAASLRTSYNTRPLTSAQFKSAIFPFEAYVDALVRAEEMVALAAASNRRSPLRPYMTGQTSNLADGAAVPKLTATGKEIIGVWGQVRDASTGEPVVEAAPAEIALLNRNANAWRVSEVYLFCADGDVVRHTRPATSVFAAVCFYDRVARAAAVSADSAALFPGVSEAALLSGLLSEMTRDSQFAAQAAAFATYFAVVLGALGSAEPPPPPPAEVAAAMAAARGGSE